MHCCTEEELITHATERLSGLRGWQVQRHVNGCTRCQQEQRRLQTLGTHLQELSAATPTTELDFRVQTIRFTSAPRPAPHSRWVLPGLWKPIIAFLAGIAVFAFYGGIRTSSRPIYMAEARLSVAQATENAYRQNADTLLFFLQQERAKIGYAVNINVETPTTLRLSRISPSEKDQLETDIKKAIDYVMSPEISERTGMKISLVLPKLSKDGIHTSQDVIYANSETRRRAVLPALVVTVVLLLIFQFGIPYPILLGICLGGGLFWLAEQAKTPRYTSYGTLIISSKEKKVSEEKIKKYLQDAWIAQNQSDPLFTYPVTNTSLIEISASGSDAILLTEQLNETMRSAIKQVAQEKTNFSLRIVSEAKESQRQSGDMTLPLIGCAVGGILGLVGHLRRRRS